MPMQLPSPASIHSRISFDLTSRQICGKRILKAFRLGTPSRVSHVVGKLSMQRALAAHRTGRHGIRRCKSNKGLQGQLLAESCFHRRKQRSQTWRRARSAQAQMRLQCMFLCRHVGELCVPFPRELKPFSRFLLCLVHCACRSYAHGHCRLEWLRP